MTLGISSKLHTNTSGSDDLAADHHRVLTAVDDLELCTSQRCFALGCLPGDSIVLIHAQRAEQAGVDGFVDTPIAIGHSLEDSGRFRFPNMLSSAGFGRICNDGAVQGILNDCIAQ